MSLIAQRDLPLKAIDLGVARVCRIGFDDSVFPEPAVVRSFNLDGRGSVADVLAIYFDFSTGGFRDDQEFLSRSRGMSVRCAAGANQRKGGDQGRKNGMKSVVEARCIEIWPYQKREWFVSHFVSVFRADNWLGGGWSMGRRGER